MWFERLQHGRPAKELQVGLVREIQEQLAVAPSQPSGEPYRFDFGKFSRKTLDQATTAQANYLAWCVASKIHETRPMFGQALRDAGLLDGLLQQGQALKLQKAEAVVAKQADSANLHPEIQKLRQAQLEDALGVLQDVGILVEDESVQRPPTKAKVERKRRSRAMVQLHNCVHCGSLRHNSSTCRASAGQIAAAAGVKSQRLLVATELAKNKKMAKVVSRLKYTSVAQRSRQYDKRPSQRSRGTVRRSFVGLLQASPLQLTKALLQDGLLCNLEGAACPNSRCESGNGIVAERRLGKLTECTKWQEKAITSSSVHYRCLHCRCRVRVNHGSTLFSGVGGGTFGPTWQTLGFWNCVQGITLTQTCLQLNIHADPGKGLGWRVSSHHLPWPVLFAS
jgi:hypothetical protein